MAPKPKRRTSKGTASSATRLRTKRVSTGSSVAAAAPRNKTVDMKEPDKESGRPMDKVSLKKARLSRADTCAIAEGEPYWVWRRDWLVWPPYVHVQDIPKAHVAKYKDLISSTKGICKPTGLRPSVPGPEGKRQETCDKASKPPRMLAWQAKYKVLYQNTVSGRWVAICVEPGWEKTHSRDFEVEFDDKDLPVALDKSGGEVNLGFVL